MGAESNGLMACEKSSWPKHRESVTPTGPSCISSLLVNKSPKMCHICDICVASTKGNICRDDNPNSY